MDEVLVRFYDSVLPDDSINDSSISARDRLVASLQRLLSPAASGVDPRDAWGQVFARYATDAPAEGLRDEYVAVEREVRRRIEYSLTVLQEEGSLAPGDNARRARFLYTVVNGLSIAQALPSVTSLPQIEIEIDVLGTAAEYVLNER